MHERTEKRTHGATSKTSPTKEPSSKTDENTPPMCQEQTTGNSVCDIESAAREEAEIPPLVKPRSSIPGVPSNYCNRRTWITTERMNELRRKAQEAVKQNKTFTIRGCFNSVRNALLARGWVEKLHVHRRHTPTGICQVTYDDLAQGLPKRKPGETRRQYIAKCERNIMSRFLEHMAIDFLWTNRKEKCDYIDQTKNPVMTINKFHRAPFTSKEGLCSQLKDFHWYYEEGTSEMYFPRCFNVWSPEELCEFAENFKLTACIAFVRLITDRYRERGYDAIFSPIGKIPFTSVDFAYKRCSEYINYCQHNDIDLEDPPKIWEHDWDAFLYQHYQLANEGDKILLDPQRLVDTIIHTGLQLLDHIRPYWPQYSLDGYKNLWIVKPANKCRGRGIQLMDNLKKILTLVNPPIASKSRYVVQKYIERPLIIHQTKFDIRQWFLITNVQPLIVWMYKESYLRFSSQEYSLSNHHESVHLTNYAIQKKYTNAKRDKRLPNENMWDCYSFQAYLRQIGKQDMWMERIYPGMRKAIVGTMLASQEAMDRRPNTFELFGADFMICENFYPWLIEINSSPDLGATTSVTARMCPQCLEDVIKVVIDRRADPKADLGKFELIYRQMVPPTPAYMGLNLIVKGKQIITKTNPHHGYYYYQRKERSLHTSNIFRQRTTLIPSISNVHKAMPIFNATEYIEKCMFEATNSSRSSLSAVSGVSGLSAVSAVSAVSALSAVSGTSGVSSAMTQQYVRLQSTGKLQRKPPTSTVTAPNLLSIPQVAMRRTIYSNLAKICARAQKHGNSGNDESQAAIKRHRSCGPRLMAACNDGDIGPKFKFTIKKCALQQSNGDNGSQQALNAKALVSPTATSKSEDNIVVLLHHTQHPDPVKLAAQQTQDLQLQLRSQSCIIERNQLRRTSVSGCTHAQRKWRSRQTGNCTACSNSEIEPIPENTANLHPMCVGKGIIARKPLRHSRKTTTAKYPTNSSTPTTTTTTTATTPEPDRTKPSTARRRSSEQSSYAQARNALTRC